MGHPGWLLRKSQFHWNRQAVWSHSLLATYILLVSKLKGTLPKGSDSFFENFFRTFAGEHDQETERESQLEIFCVFTKLAPTTSGLLENALLKILDRWSCRVLFKGLVRQSLLQLCQSAAAHAELTGTCLVPA